MKVERSSSINFRAGLTKQIQNDINTCNINKISHALERYYNIPNDFKGNKVLAWCSLVCIELIEHMNNTFNTNFGFPNGIFVEDLAKTSLCIKNAPGLVNIKPEFLYHDKDTFIKENTVIFNEYPEDNYNGGNRFWDNIDSLADEHYEKKIYGTDNFLEMILHEFAHAMHYNHLIKQHGSKNASRKIYEILNPNSIPAYHSINKWLIQKNVCKYATVNPFETIACDLSERIINNIKENTTYIEDNFIPNSPYRKQNKLQLFLSKFKTAKNEDEEFEQLIYNYWNGRFKQ